MSIFDDPKPDATAPAATPPVVAPIPIPRSIFDDPVSQPGVGSQLLNDYGKPGLKLAARVPLHVAMAPMDLGVGAAKAIGAGADKLGLTSPQPTLLDTDGTPLTGPDAPPRASPSQDLINSLGLTMDPDAGVAMRTADAVLPVLASGWQGKLSRIAEAPGTIPKLAEIGGHIVGAGADVGLQTVGGALGDYIGGPQGAFVGSLFGGSVRPGGQAGLGWLGRKGLQQRAEEPEPSGAPGLPSSEQVFDAMTNPEGPNAFPSFGQVTNETGKRLEKGVGSFPVDFGVGAARDAAEQGFQRSINTGTGIVGDRPAGAGPVDQTRTAQNIIDLSREANANQQSALSAREQAIEDAINATEAGERTPVSPLVDTVSQIANRGPGPVSRPMQPRVKDLYETLNPTDDPNDLTSPWSDLKILSQDLGQRTNTTDLVKGRPTIGRTGPTETPCAAGRRWRAKGRSLTRRPPTTRRSRR